MTKQEELEALKDMCNHYGLPILLAELDSVIANIKEGLLSVPLDKDPEKAALTLYAERMKLEGAVSTRNAFIAKIKAVKEKK